MPRFYNWPASSKLEYSVTGPKPPLRPDGGNEINIETTNVVTFDNLDSLDFYASADANVVIKGAFVSRTSLSARCDLTLESDAASLSQLSVSMNGGYTLTLAADGSNNAITDLTLDSTGNVTLTGAPVSELKQISAEVGGTMTITADMMYAALAYYSGAEGANNIHLSDYLGTITVNLNCGNDVFTSTAAAGTLIVVGGAGTDSFTLSSGAGATHIINVTDPSDLKITGISDASALSAALAADAFEVVTNFSSGTDKLYINNFRLSDISVVL